MDFEKTAKNVWNSWWLQPLLGGAVLFLITAAVSHFFIAEAAPVIIGILIAFTVTAAWAGIRKKRETSDYKKILIAGYAVGVVLAIATEFLIEEFPPYRYREILALIFGSYDGMGPTISFGRTALESVWQGQIMPLIIFAFFAAGIASALVAAAAAKYLTKNAKKKKRK